MLQPAKAEDPMSNASVTPLVNRIEAVLRPAHLQRLRVVHVPLRTGKTITVGFGLVVRSANGVGSRFRATTNHMEDALPENDSRPLLQFGAGDGPAVAKDAARRLAAMAKAVEQIAVA
jgi:hypothetical protein